MRMHKIHMVIVADTRLFVVMDQRLQGVLDFGQKIKTEGNEVWPRPRTMRLANKTG